MARIGDDAFGRMALDLWAREGIIADAVGVVAGERSGVAQILVFDDGDNSIAVAPGAGAALGAAQVRAAAALVGGARVVMSSCEVPFEATQAAFEMARASGATTLLNPAPARPLPDALLGVTDILTPNQNELRALTGVDDTAAAGQALIARGPRAVVVTLGSHGCAWFERGQAPASLPGHAVDVVDTIGAGDTFTGALAAALARGDTLEQAARWANAAAALSVTRAGATGGMPSRDAVSAWLAVG
jgi:ribokinase